MRIAIGGFLHESHSFAPMPTTYADFLHPSGNPGLVRGPALLDALRGSAAAAGGAIRAVEERGDTPVPLLWCLATPAGPVQAEAFERIAAMLCATLADATADPGELLDGIFLDLHGAALAEGAPDARVSCCGGCAPSPGRCRSR